MIFGTVLGQKEFQKAMEARTKEISFEVGQALAEATLMVHSEAIRSIAAKGSSSGVEVRYNPRREQKVSAPGKPPNTDTGRLVQSIQFEIDVNKGVGLVGTNEWYGAALEFGTSSMDERPWLSPAFMKILPKAIKMFERAFKKGSK